jgi:hypothetical protein
MPEWPCTCLPAPFDFPCEGCRRNAAQTDPESTLFGLPIVEVDDIDPQASGPITLGPVSGTLSGVWDDGRAICVVCQQRFTPGPEGTDGDDDGRVCRSGLPGLRCGGNGTVSRESARQTFGEAVSQSTHYFCRAPKHSYRVASNRFRMPRMKISPALILAALLITGAPSITHAQSLADAAKRAAAEHDKNKDTPSKVYTNKDLKTVERDRSAAAAAPIAAPAPTAAEALPAPASAPTLMSVVSLTTEPQWKARRAELQSALDRDQIFVVAMQGRIDALDVSLANVVYRLEQLQLERQKEEALTELTRLKAVAVSDALAIRTFEEEARRAGIPAGWLRP